MKKNILLTLVFVAVVSFAFAQISTTQHNFIDEIGTNDSWNDGTQNKACGPCHTPHNATTDAPLWSHAGGAAAGWTPYNNAVSATMNAAPGQPDGASLMCLGCHDGVTALDDFAGNDGLSGAVMGDATHYNGTTALVGGGTQDLSSDHPVSFVYDNALAAADGALYSSNAAVTSGGGALISVQYLDAAGKVQCTSCHDAHSSNSKFLRIVNTNSEMCLDCHNK